tara:strand:+ start:2067 stop:2375 length:309 start_codon:yes stop_codon:yes gene_type:complete
MRNQKLNLHLFILICAGVFFGSCTHSQKSQKYSIEQAPNIQCCMVRGRDGRCYEEIVPDCYKDSAPLFQEKFFNPDSCCAYWGVDGMCYEELVKNCSEQYRL